MEMNEKTTNNVNKKSRKGIILTIIFAVVTPTIGGIGAGIVINKFFIGKSTNYDSINSDDLVDNTVAQTLNKYQAIVDSGEEVDYGNYFKAYEIFTIGYDLFARAENNMSFTVGMTDAGIVQQTIRGSSIKNGNLYFEESISKSSMVSLANRTYVLENDSINLYRGEALDKSLSKYKPEHYEYTLEEYTEEFGKTPKSPLIYIVNKSTVLAKTSSVTKNEDGSYTVKTSLNPVTGVYNYVKQMKNISNLGDYPSFDYVNLTLTTDENLLVKKLHIDEGYYAKMGAVGSDLTAKMDIAYYVNTDQKIPTINQLLAYPEEL